MALLLHLGVTMPQHAHTHDSLAVDLYSDLDALHAGATTAGILPIQLQAQFSMPCGSSKDSCTVRCRFLHKES